MPDLVFRWEFKPTGAPSSRLFGVDVVDPDVVFAVGSPEQGGPQGGAVVRTTDGGDSWQVSIPPDGNALPFHDVHAFDADHAVVLSAGQGSGSRIYKD
jgi:photosystem II stability/assembly factor-like uncharacterized protein